MKRWRILKQRAVNPSPRRLTYNRRDPLNTFFRLNKHTIHFFYNEHTHDFPLYTEAIKFFNHSESMVRIAVRYLTFNVGLETILHFNFCDFCYHFWMFLLCVKFSANLVKISYNNHNDNINDNKDCFSVIQPLKGVY